MAVRGLRCEFKGFRGDAALPHCCDRRAFLLAFIFSRRFTRWLLVISISSILSRAVRSCGGTEERRYTQPADVSHFKVQACVFTSLWSFRFSALSSSSTFSALSADALYLDTCPSSLLIWKTDTEEYFLVTWSPKTYNLVNIIIILCELLFSLPRHFYLTYILFHCTHFLFCLRNLKFVFTNLSVGISYREKQNPVSLTIQKIISCVLVQNCEANLLCISMKCRSVPFSILSPSVYVLSIFECFCLSSSSWFFSFLIWANSSSFSSANFRSLTSTKQKQNTLNLCNVAYRVEEVYVV